MKLANKITLSRFVFTAIALVLLYTEGFEAKVGALVFFIVSIVSDKLDGMIAQRFNQRSFFGKIFDQTADKVLVNLFWLALLDLRLLPFWLVALNLFREIVVVSIRGVVGTKGVILESKKTGKAEFAGRLKAALQMLVILAGLALIVMFFQPAAAVVSFLAPWALSTIFWLGVVAVAVSYWALADLLWKSRKVLLKDA
jgi:cardiolipin synthase